MRLRLAVLVVLLAWVPALCAQGAPGRFRIAGTAVSTRDGSPIPFCRMQLAPATDANAAAPPGIDGPDRFGRGDGSRSRPFPGRGRAGETSADAAGANGATDILTDAHGHFAFSPAHAGEWRLTGVAHGFRRQYYDAHDGFFADIVLSAAVPAVNLQFRMAPDGEISGLVLDEAGEPVVNGQVFVEQAPPLNGSDEQVAAYRPVGNASTDDRGRYEVGGLAPGPYRVRVQAQPWYAVGAGLRLNVVQPGQDAPDPSLDLVYATVWFPGTVDPGGAQTIELKPGEERQADLHLTPIPAVHLHYTQPTQPTDGSRDRTRQNFGLYVTRVSPPAFGQASASSDGSNYDFGSLTPGTYEIHLPGPDGEPEGDVRQFVVRPDSPGTVDLASATPLIRVAIAVEGSSDPRGVDFLLLDTDSGRAIPVDTRRLRRGDEDRDSPRERSISLAPGTYRAVLNGQTMGLTGISAEGAQVDGLTVRIAAGAVNPKLTLHVAAASARLDGLVARSGAPVEGAMLLLVPVTLGEPGNTARGGARGEQLGRQLYAAQRAAGAVYRCGDRPRLGRELARSGDAGALPFGGNSGRAEGWSEG